MKQDFRWPENAQFWPFNIRTFWWMSLVNTHSVEVSSLDFSVSWRTIHLLSCPPSWGCGRGSTRVEVQRFLISSVPAAVFWVSLVLLQKVRSSRSLLGHLTCARLDSLAWVYLSSWMMPEWVGAKKPVVWLNKITAACPMCIVLSVGAFQPVIRGLTASLGWM